MIKQIKNTKSIFVILPLFAALFFTACNDFLDEAPSRSSNLVVSTTEELDALLGNHAVFKDEDNYTAIYSTDDFGLTTEIYNARPNTFALQILQYALWDTQYLPLNTTDSFWTMEYRKIFNANLVLDNLDRVSGSDADKARLRSEAHFIRAYSYLTLAQVYCLPFTDATRDEPGLPIKTTTSFDESMDRGTLAALYELIESDLAEALNTSSPLIQSGTARHWRANTAAVNGFAARYYLIRNNYENALTYANNALAEYSTLVDYNTEMAYGRSSTVNINTGTADAQTVVLNFPYTHNNQIDLTDMFAWKELLYLRMLNNGYWWYLPSQELIDLYDHTNDLRYVYHYVENYSYDRGLVNPAYSWPGYIFFYKDRIPSGPTVPEMFLIKAEAQARLNQVSDAMSTVNMLREKRMLPGPWVNLTASNQDDAIREILEERRRELPFTRRWSDIRRLNNNDYANDDVNLSRSFYPYTASSVLTDQPAQTYQLPRDSRRFAAPIFNTDIISSQGAIIQNTY